MGPDPCGPEAISLVGARANKGSPRGPRVLEKQTRADGKVFGQICRTLARFSYQLARKEDDSEEKVICW